MSPAPRRPILLAWAVLACAATAPAADGEWVAPAGERARPNPVPDSPEALRKGRALYQRHCTACHGEKGRGDGPAGADAADLTDGATQQRLSDGEMAMPAFARQVGAQDRWKLVLFVRSLGTPSP